MIDGHLKPSSNNIAHTLYAVYYAVDNTFYCATHGKLGEGVEAIQEQKVHYSGERGLEGYHCVACVNDAIREQEESKRRTPH